MKSRLLILLSALCMTFVMNAQVTSVAIIGSGTAGGWDTETPMELADDTLQLYYLKVNLTANEVKFRANNAWAINWGAVDFPLGTGVQGGPNIPVAVAGEYEILFSAITGEYFFYYESPIGIIGSATPYGWDEDINLFPNATDTNKYFITLPLIQGAAKFRKDDLWATNWGSENFPSGIGTQDGKDIPIPNAGKYSITFDKSTGEYDFQELIDFKSIGIIGSATAGGWDNETPLTRDGGNADVWKGTVNIKEGEFKFRADSAWTISWGGGTFPSDTASLTGGNIAVTADQAGDYLVTFNTKSLIYNFLKIEDFESIGIIGDATPGGWDNETKMIQDANDKSIWRLRVDLVAGEAKFRANNDWVFNWGSADFPSGTGVQDGANIPVVAGDYKITFNSTTGEYNFEAVVEYDKISLVGNAGPFGDWPGDDDSRDTYLNKNPNDANHWTLASVTLKDTPVDGGIKFRAEAAWAINWGSAAFPVGVGTQNGANIQCTAGTYKIDFRSDTGDYAFAEPSSTYDLLSSDVIKIFPNPAKDVLNVEINTDALRGNVTATLFNINGEQIKSQIFQVNGIAKMNVSDVIAGNYVLRISNDKNLVAKSVLIVK
ncbi:MAG: SusF/SusE family outer membrane protein [Saprospiraceae bacterium]|nr:SusF/SusE family outer membrane protein [Saprospiraceae bacterium]